MDYLKKWEASVAETKGFNSGKKEKMLLSTETLEGLRTTGKIFIVLYNCQVGMTIIFC